MMMMLIVGVTCDILHGCTSTSSTLSCRRIDISTDLKFPDIQKIYVKELIGGIISQARIFGCRKITRVVFGTVGNSTKCEGDHQWKEMRTGNLIYKKTEIVKVLKKIITMNK